MNKCKRCKKDKTDKFFSVYKSSGRLMGVCKACKAEMKRNNLSGINNTRTDTVRKKSNNELVLERFFDKNGGMYTSRDIRSITKVKGNIYNILRPLIDAEIIIKFKNGGYEYTYQNKNVADLSDIDRSKKMLEDYAGDFDPMLEQERRVERWIAGGMGVNEIKVKMRDYRGWSE